MLEFIKQKKNLLIIIGIIILVGIYWFFNMSTTTQDITTQDNMLEVAENTNEDEVESEEDIIIVHITGGINNPGIVKLKENSRIEDAIDAAGGLTEDSDISGVNLAYMLEDGIKIRIPMIDDDSDASVKEESYITEDSGKNVILEDNSESSSNSIVNINKATQTELETLPGIGPSLATKIIEYRENNGKFSKKEDIKNVTGIGDSKYSSIEEFIVVK